LRLKNGKYEVFKTPFFKFNDTNCNESPPNICVLPDGTVYFGANMGLLKYLPEEDRGLSHSFITLFSQQRILRSKRNEKTQPGCL
jgi:hypothetical protein